MTESYANAVSRQLRHVPAGDRRRAIDALRAQLDELAVAGIAPREALGEPVAYAAELAAALADDAPGAQAQGSVLGLPVETRGPVSAAVRSRTWDPTDPRVIVPRLFGIGWTLNLGAVAVRLGLLRPDDWSVDTLAAIPEPSLRAAQWVPVAIAATSAAALALSWRTLPPTVASGFGLTGRPRKVMPRRGLLGAVALGLAPALWAARSGPSAEDRLVGAANATSLAVISAGVVAATTLAARQPGGRWGLLVPATLPLAVGASLAVVVVPLRAGLRRVWRTAAVGPTPSTPPIPARKARS